MMWWTEGPPLFVIGDNDENHDVDTAASVWKEVEVGRVHVGGMGVSPPGLGCVVFVVE